MFRMGDGSHVGQQNFCQSQLSFQEARWQISWAAQRPGPELNLLRSVEKIKTWWWRRGAARIWVLRRTNWSVQQHPVWMFFVGFLKSAQSLTDTPWRFLGDLFDIIIPNLFFNMKYNMFYWCLIGEKSVLNTIGGYRRYIGLLYILWASHVCTWRAPQHQHCPGWKHRDKQKLYKQKKEEDQR